MPLTTCKSFYFSPFTSEYHSDLSVASSSSSLWDYTLLQPVPPAMCYCHIRKHQEVIPLFRASVSWRSQDFLLGNCGALAEVGPFLRALQHFTTPLCGDRYDSSQGTIVFVWMGKRVWVKAYECEWKEEAMRGEKMNPVYEQCIVICSGFAVELCF